MQQLINQTITVMKNQKEIRNAFWNEFPQFKSEYRSNKRQNDYCCDIRCAFVEWVDSLMKSGRISEKLCNNVTL